jgi:hypothetical protein
MVPQPRKWLRGQTVVLKPGAHARSRPLDPAARVVTAPGLTLTLGTAVANPAGRWWYANWPGGSGWVLESDLQAPAN